MSFPPPTPGQARWLWSALTGLAVAVLLGLIGAFIFATGLVVRELASVLTPLAIAGIVAYLLDPLVDVIEAKGVPRARAILLVFFIAVMAVLILLATVVPQLVFETQALIKQLPDYVDKLKGPVTQWLANSPVGTRAVELWDSNLGTNMQSWLAERLPRVTSWLAGRVSALASWAGFLAGLALVPVYVFYFLLEEKAITQSWTRYLPMTESKLKNELVFVVNAINDCLIVFFRGQVLVALCDGVLLTIGFWMMGLNYAFLFGMMAGLLSIVPYLGVMISIVPTVILAVVQFGDWIHPLMVVALFGLVQTLEGLVISPKIIGDRVGLHPLTIIIAVMVGTSLLGGILGGVLAIPLTAAIRSILTRYVWARQAPAGAS
ncbi:MAG: AI-2E family transporter [Verrucomicrobia bacterium]|nr:AI-2E family transporter [Verrucomicrobiota bacterium]